MLSSHPSGAMPVCLAANAGYDPTPTGSKPVVLPLHQSAVLPGLGRHSMPGLVRRCQPLFLFRRSVREKEGRKDAQAVSLRAFALTVGRRLSHRIPRYEKEGQEQDEAYSLFIITQSIIIAQAEAMSERALHDRCDVGSVRQLPVYEHCEGVREVIVLVLAHH